MDDTNNVSIETPLQGIYFHPVIRLLAKVISFIFHPLFIPLYISWFLIYQSSIFPAFTPFDNIRLFAMFFVMYTLFPLVTVLLTKGLGFIESIYLKTQRDRIIPYVAFNLYSFWMWYVLRTKFKDSPLLVMLSLAIFLSSSLGLILNGFVKVSMHAISVGVMVTFMLLLGFSSDINIGIYISLALLITGSVCTSRLINGDHYPVEIYLGLFLGIISQLIAYWLV